MLTLGELKQIGDEIVRVDFDHFDQMQPKE
jgi:hypothetical protein